MLSTVSFHPCPGFLKNIPASSLSVFSYPPIPYNFPSSHLKLGLLFTYWRVNRIYETCDSCCSPSKALYEVNTDTQLDDIFSYTCTGNNGMCPVTGRRYNFLRLVIVIRPKLGSPTNTFCSLSLSLPS